MAAARGGKYGLVTASEKEFHANEPVFILRATDPLAAELVYRYAIRCDLEGCGETHVADARAAAAAIRQWQEDNPGLVKKKPD